MKLTKDFYLDQDVTNIAKHLLGKVLVTRLDDKLTSGIIVETEAYCGRTDRASHAFPNKVTGRTQTMFKEGGLAYIYFVYGMHHLFNVVTNLVGQPDAVLIRSVEPTQGVKWMKKRRRMDRVDRFLTGGPARLTQALGISVNFNGISLLGDQIWIEEGYQPSSNLIMVSTRVGVDYAGTDAQLPWRYFLKENPFVSKGL